MGGNSTCHQHIRCHYEVYKERCEAQKICYDRFSSPVRTEGRGGSEVEEILTAAHREFGGCTHCCVGKPKRREQDRASQEEGDAPDREQQKNSCPSRATSVGFGQGIGHLPVSVT